jgi:hypothetical protein
VIKPHAKAFKCEWAGNLTPTKGDGFAVFLGGSIFVVLYVNVVGFKNNVEAIIKAFTKK